MGDETVGILNDLLAAEARRLVGRLGEAAPFASRGDAERLRFVTRLIREHREHVEWLAEAVTDRGGAPVIPPPDPRTTSVHYTELGYMLSRVAAEERRLLELYEAAAERLRDPGAILLVRRIMERRREYLECLPGLVREKAAS